MSELTPKLAADIAAACTARAAKIAGALTGALDSEITLGDVKQGDHAGDAATSLLDGPGLLVLLTVGESGLALCLPQSTELLPAWCAAPDAPGKSKLATLGQELGMLFLPETMTCDSARAQWVESLSAALRSGGAATDAALIALEARSGEKSGQLSLVWPLSSPTATYDATIVGDESATPESPGANASDASRRETSASETANAAGTHSVSELPHYSRSLLKIALPVSVQLASKKETVKEVVELVPGSIIKFDKGCDELLQMVIGGQSVAEGEAIKIGDKFGFRVTGLLLPREHFIKVKRPRAGDPSPAATNKPQLQGA